jgi:hypothetical protein
LLQIVKKMVTGSEKEFPDPRDDEEEDVVDVAGDHQLQGRILKVIAVRLLLGWKKWILLLVHLLVMTMELNYLKLFCQWFRVSSRRTKIFVRFFDLLVLRQVPDSGCWNGRLRHGVSQAKVLWIAGRHFSLDCWVCL